MFGGLIGFQTPNNRGKTASFFFELLTLVKAFFVFILQAKNLEFSSIVSLWLAGLGWGEVTRSTRGNPFFIQQCILVVRQCP